MGVIQLSSLLSLDFFSDIIFFFFKSTASQQNYREYADTSKKKWLIGAQKDRKYKKSHQERVPCPKYVWQQQESIGIEMFMWEVYISMAMSMAERLKRRQKICTTKNTLMKEIKDYTNRWKDIPLPQIRRINIVKRLYYIR